MDHVHILYVVNLFHVVLFMKLEISNLYRDLLFAIKIITAFNRIFYLFFDFLVNMIFLCGHW